MGKHQICGMIKTLHLLYFWRVRVSGRSMRELITLKDKKATEKYINKKKLSLSYLIKKYCFILRIGFSNTQIGKFEIPFFIHALQSWTCALKRLDIVMLLKPPILILVTT